MPRGGRRPGSGAPRGNANAATRGGASPRAYLVFAAMCLHPNNRAIVRLMRQLGIHLPGPDPDLRRVITEIYPAIFDCSHPQFNQINQRPESGWPPPVDRSRDLKTFNIPKFKEQSKPTTRLPRLLALAAQAHLEHARRPQVRRPNRRKSNSRSIYFHSAPSR